MDQTSLAALSTDTLSAEINDDEIKRGLVLVGSLEEKLLLTLEYYETVLRQATEAEELATSSFERAINAYNTTLTRWSDQINIVQNLNSIRKEKTAIKETQKGILREKYNQLGGIPHAVSILRKFSSVLEVVHG